MYKIRYCQDMDPHLIDNAVCPSKERIKKLNEENEFFIKLEQSILKEGFRNPIVIAAKKESIKCIYGGSRLMFAQKYDLKIPCIISDYDDIFPNAKILRGVPEIGKYFLDKPQKILFKPNGIRVSVLTHYHLGEKNV